MLFLLIASVALQAAAVRAQELGVDDARRAAAYAPYWKLADAPGVPPAGTADPLDSVIADARHDFGGRGPALARWFLRHPQPPPDDDAFFFLFRAVGDVPTARVLIDALADVPAAATGDRRDLDSVRAAIEALLRNEPIRNDPRLVAALDAAIVRLQALPARRRALGTVLRILARCGSPEAGRRLWMLAADPDPALRAAAVEVLAGEGESPAVRMAQRALAGDPDPAVRARAARALAESRSGTAAVSLAAALSYEVSPEAVDAMVAALTALRALPPDPAACLALANRVWDPAVARAPFDCWRATTDRAHVISQARSGRWAVRALALHSLAPRPQTASAGPPLDAAVRESLFRSVLEILAQRVSPRPAPDGIANMTLQLTRDALWEFSGGDMAVALAVADRVVPLHGRQADVGRFGASLDLAARDPRAYAALRRREPLEIAGLAAALFAALLAMRPLRVFGASMASAIGLWAAWVWTHPDVSVLPPPPLTLLTASTFGFLAAGLCAGVIAYLPVRAWMKSAAAPGTAAAAAYLACRYTRVQGLFPLAEPGSRAMPAPVESAVLAASAALAITLALAAWRWRRRPKVEKR